MRPDDEVTCCSTVFNQHTKLVVWKFQTIERGSHLKLHQLDKPFCWMFFCWLLILLTLSVDRSQFTNSKAQNLLS